MWTRESPPTTPGLWTPVALLDYTLIRHRVCSTSCFWFSLQISIFYLQVICELLGQGFSLFPLAIYLFIHPSILTPTTSHHLHHHHLKSPSPLTWTKSFPCFHLCLLTDSPQKKHQKAMLNLVISKPNHVTPLLNLLSAPHLSQEERPKSLHWPTGPCGICHFLLSCLWCLLVPLFLLCSAPATLTGLCLACGKHSPPAFRMLLCQEVSSAVLSAEFSPSAISSLCLNVSFPVSSSLMTTLILNWKPYRTGLFILLIACLDQ